MYADFMWKQEKCMIYRKVKTNLSRTLSSIEQDKATSDDYVKCILADPQIAAYQKNYHHRYRKVWSFE